MRKILPSNLAGTWTLKQLMQITYKYYYSRFDYMKRDVVKSAIKVTQISVYDGKNPGEARTRFLIKSSSYPQYRPYFTGFDKRGRKIRYQRTYKHTYDIILQLDKLSLNCPFKMRIGSARMYNFNPPKNLIRSKKNPKGKYLSVGDYNIEVLGINPDFFFRLDFIYWTEKILYGRHFAKWMPKRETNKYGLPFLTKHCIWVIKVLMERGILKDD